MIFKKKKILFVEDNESIRITALNILEEWKYKVLSADRGDTALKIAKEEQPGLIILDVKIPGINGFDLCKLLKKDQATKKTPVILLTGLSKMGEVDRGFKAGADTYITKPVDWDKLKKEIKKLL